MQTFMYAVSQDHHKSDKGRSSASQCDKKYDAEGIYRDLAKHALSSTAAPLVDDTLLQYVITTRYQGT
jgi:hypothetical protein